MIYIDTLDTFWSPQTSPTVCMHCVNPPCANVCPVDAIKVDQNGIVLSALTDRCIYCRNCHAFGRNRFLFPFSFCIQRDIWG